MKTETKIEQEFEEWLSTLGPSDLNRDLGDELSRYTTAVANARSRFQHHLSYLRLMSAREVILPDDLYFAQVRQKITARVRIKPVSRPARIRALLLPERMRPLQGIVSGALAALLLVTLVFFPGAEKPHKLSGLDRYVCLKARFSGEVELLRRGPLWKEVESEHIDILLRTAAILSSPSSLSRSRAFGNGGK